MPMKCILFSQIITTLFNHRYVWALSMRITLLIMLEKITVNRRFKDVLDFRGVIQIHCNYQQN